MPTLLRVANGVEQERLVGWVRAEWRALTGVAGLGPGLPAWRPGCGSLSVDPDLAPELAVRFGAAKLRARRVELAAREDEMEAAYERGWTDGLPIIPPTEKRVLAMLAGTTRDPQQLVATVPPDLVECSVEKVAINAVMAGCKPEYLPVVLAAVEAACTSEFNMHGLLATTMPAAPVLIVNGPIRRAIGMNAGINVFGQGCRANRDDRPRAAARGAQRRRWAARRSRSRHLRQSRQDRLLLPRGRRGIALDAALGGLRLRAGHQHGDAVPGRGAALDRRSALA